jgi:hypothetical protein
MVESLHEMRGREETYLLEESSKAKQKRKQEFSKEEKNRNLWIAKKKNNL